MVTILFAKLESEAPVTVNPVWAKNNGHRIPCATIVPIWNFATQDFQLGRSSASAYKQYEKQYLFSWSHNQLLNK